MRFAKVGRSALSGGLEAPGWESRMDVVVKVM
jgi:hypothetical protein